MNTTSELELFLQEWKEDTSGIKTLFRGMHELLRSLDNVTLEYKARPGVSHSLRAALDTDNVRPLFVLVDIIDDDPKNRWLSVCFYADLVFDPDEKGDVVPSGLFGEDARCFDIEAATGYESYILDRLREAWVNAAASR